MKTVLVGKEDIMEVRQNLLDGLVVSFPTETVFGLAAKFDNPEAVDRLFELKGRDKTKAITLMVGSWGEIDDFCEVTAAERKIIEAFMPGKITLILKKKAGVEIPYLESTVGIRIPDDEFVLELLKQTGPLLVTSANRAGQPVKISSEEVLGEFDGEIPLIVAGRCKSHKPSTVFRLVDGAVEILRPGQVELEEITEVLK